MSGPTLLLILPVPPLWIQIFFQIQLRLLRSAILSPKPTALDGQGQQYPGWFGRAAATTAIGATPITGFPTILPDPPIMSTSMGHQTKPAPLINQPRLLR